VLFFPPRKGRFYEYEDWYIIETLKHKIEQGFLQIYCIDSIDRESFYNPEAEPFSKINRHLQYEQYVTNEVLPLIHLKNPDSYMISAGCSMGAYHAVNFALKYPLYFNKIVAMSGRYDLTQQMSHYEDLLRGYWDENIYFNMPAQYINNLSDEKLLTVIRGLEIVLAVGGEDVFLKSNQLLHEALLNKGIPNNLYIWEGEAHKPRNWQEMVNIYL
jgi:esterase/lipase superfamily enzyme